MNQIKLQFMMVSLVVLSLAGCASKGGRDAAPSSVSAATTATCAKLTECSEKVARITGQKYIFSGKLEDAPVHLTSNLELNKENAEIIFTQALLLHSLTRVPTGEPNTFAIIEAKNALQSAIPVYEGSLKQKITLPKTHDIITVKYKMQDKTMADQLQRYLVDLVPRYGRISSYPDTGTLIITDSAPNIERILEVLRPMDRPASKEFLRDLERLRKERAAKKS